MGADGHMVVVRRADWAGANPDVEPGEIGLYTGEILGVSAVWGYYGDNLMGCGHNDWNNYGVYLEHDNPTTEHLDKRKAALTWFDANMVWHEVWT